MDIIGLILVGAGVSEAVAEYLFSPLLDATIGNTESNKNLRTAIFYALTAGLGVLIAFAFNLGFFSLLGAELKLPFVDNVLTGIVLGRGSTFVHDFVSKYLVKSS